MPESKTRLPTGDRRKMTTNANPNEAAPVYWPRVKELLDTIMDRWIDRHGRQPYPGIHEYWWETPEDLANSVLNGYPSIEPGVPGAETHLVRSLRLGCGTLAVCLSAVHSYPAPKLPKSPVGLTPGCPKVLKTTNRKLRPNFSAGVREPTKLRGE